MRRLVVERQGVVRDVVAAVPRVREERIAEPGEPGVKLAADAGAPSARASTPAHSTVRARSFVISVPVLSSALERGAG